MYFLNCCGTEEVSGSNFDILNIEDEYILYKYVLPGEEWEIPENLEEFLFYVVKGKGITILFFSKKASYLDFVYVLEAQKEVKNKNRKIVTTDYGLLYTLYDSYTTIPFTEDHINNFTGIFTSEQLKNVDKIYKTKISVNPNSGNCLYMLVGKNTLKIDKDSFLSENKILKNEQVKFVNYTIHLEKVNDYLSTKASFSPFATNDKNTLLSFLNEANYYNINYRLIYNTYCVVAIPSEKTEVYKSFFEKHNMPIQLEKRYVEKKKLEKCYATIKI